jgi:ABC-type lipoprotein release transport system permease subunit
MVAHLANTHGVEPCEAREPLGVIGDGMRIAAIGGALGVVAGAGALRILQSQFAGVLLVDTWAAALASAMLCVTMVGACYLPARRASRLDPAEALRCD